VPAERVTVIPNAVDLDRFPLGGAADAGLAADLGLSGKTVLGFIGSFYAYEGLGLLLGALPRILSERTDVRVLLVGGGREEERLKDLARQLGVADRVVLAGRVPHDHVQRYYDLVDVFVYPRLPMRLTDLVTPLKPLEAMARGRLVVASDVGGHCELIRDGVTGSLFRAGSSEALALAVLDLLARPGDWPERRAAARRFVETERTWQASVARYPDVYRAALRRVGRG
jgi:PEP-CTERM/exosortase A-associated glycosyltransferase